MIHVSRSILPSGVNIRQWALWAVLVLLAVALTYTVLAPLSYSWRTDASLSHGPLVPFISAVLLWQHRDKLRLQQKSTLAGLIPLIVSTLLFLGATWADIEFLKPLMFIAMIASTILFLCGPVAFKETAGALGFLVFMIPWPTTVTERLGFPLQLTSSAYASLFAGICGLPIHREGVEISVLSPAGDKAIYSILIAQKCNGLTSLMVLLALGYLIAYYTPVHFGWRIALVASMVPIALFTNAVRLTFILLVGASHGASLAKWVHDHETPVLVMCCSMGIMGLRSALLAWLKVQASEQEKPDDTISTSYR